MGGSLATSAISAVIQHKLTKRVTENARETVALQIQGTDWSERDRRRRESILEQISRLIELADHEVDHRTDYQSIVKAVNRIQLSLNRDSERERGINGCINRMASLAHDVATGECRKEDLLSLQTELVEHTWRWTNS